MLIHNPWSGPDDFSSPDFSVVLLHSGVIVSRLRTRQDERICLAWVGLRSPQSLALEADVVVRGWCSLFAFEANQTGHALELRLCIVVLV